MRFNSDKDIIVFGAVYCKYCRLAKELLEKSATNWEYIDVDDANIDLPELKRKSAATTIPIIYTKILDEYVYLGGYRELCAYLS